MNRAIEAQTIRVGLLQRMVPSYRAGVFSMLAQNLAGQFSLFAGEPQPDEHVHTAEIIPFVNWYHAKNIHLLSGKFYVCWQVGLMRWLRSWDPEVLILEANPRYLHSMQAIRWMKRRNRTVIGWGLGTGGKKSPTSLAGKQWRRYLCHFDSMIAYSQSGADEYESAGFDPSKIFVAPNAVVQRPVEKIERTPDFSEEGPILLTVGRLQKRKKIAELIRACGTVSKITSIQLWVVGEGPEEDSLKSLAAETFPQTKFWGALRGSELAPLFQQADVFVLPGTGGLAIQEAMSYGLPVIVGEADGTQSNLVRPENGWLIDKDKEGQLPAVIIEAVESCQKLRQMGEVSFSIVQNDVNLENMTAVFLQAIDVVMGANGL